MRLGDDATPEAPVILPDRSNLPRRDAALGTSKVDSHGTVPLSVREVSHIRLVMGMGALIDPARDVQHPVPKLNLRQHAFPAFDTGRRGVCPNPLPVVHNHGGAV